MHTLTYFSDSNKQALFSKIEAFLNTENVEGKSISIEHNGDVVVGLIGHVPLNGEKETYRVIEKNVCSVYENFDAIQQSIAKVVGEMKSFICQSCCIENNNLSIVFLTA